MNTVIGLGKAGCNIADCFKKYPQYDVYKIDNDLVGENCFDLQYQPSPEAYERNCPDMGTFFKDVSGHVLFIIAGGGQISGAALRILSYIRDCDISVLFIKPDNKELNNTAYLQNKLAYNVLQEYARSGAFQNIYIVSNEELENAVGDVPIMEHDEKINSYLTGIIHYVNVFNNSEPVVDNREDPKGTSRIATFGIYDLKSDDELDLFDLQNLADKCYYFAINESVLKTDGKLLKKIKEHVSKNDIRVSYEIHSTKHQDSFCYYVSYSSTIQPLDN